MVVDVDINLLGTATIALIGCVATLYTKAIKAENNQLKETLMQKSESHDATIERIESNQHDIWAEIRLQRDALQVAREASIQLSANISRLNELLPRLEVGMDARVTHEQCSFRRRSTDTCVVDLRKSRNDDPGDA
jgi:hypothetical protein